MTTTVQTTMQTYELGDFPLEFGATLRPARLAYQTYGTLAPGRDNVVVCPTAFGDTATSNEWLIGPGRALDTDRWFVVVPHAFTNGLSSSPSNTAPPYDGAHFPRVTILDNVRAQHRLVTEVIGAERVRAVVGWSMGAVQAYQWAAAYPDMVGAIVPFCGAARTAPHNIVFIRSLKATLTADAAWDGGRYVRPPQVGLRAFGAVYAGWGFSQAFYWNEAWRELGFSSLDDFLAGWWAVAFLDHDANDLLALLDTWEHADIGRTPGHTSAESALGAITAPVLSMPAEKDLYFPPEDEHWSSRYVARGEVRPIPGVWGHLAGRGVNPVDVEFISAAVRDVLAGSDADERQPK